jgi:CHAD domain-containing protein
MYKLDRPEWTEQEGPAANARRGLPPMVTAYFALVRKVISDANASPDKLHGLRLATKQLRYSLELFRPCYGPGLETRLEELRDLQRLLGDIADSTATQKTLSKSAHSRAVEESLNEFLRKRSDTKIAEFRKHWAEKFDAEGRERWWSHYLERNARSPVRR